MIHVYHSGSTGNLYRIGNLLIEAGVPIREIKKALGFRLSEIAGCLVSHEHGDHAKGVHDLLKAGVDCYMGHETAAGIGVKGHRVHIVKPMDPFMVGDWKVLPFPLVHDVENLGFLMAKGKAKVLYATDTNYIPFRFNGLTHIMLGVDYDSAVLKRNVLAGHIDPARASRTLTQHMSLQTALGFFRANDMSKVQEIHILHLSNANSDEKKFKEEIERATGRPVYIA
uniref:Putative beta-lactamase superfamily domain n=1 Tax=viral metagenome TaxID=1070528 RepID=A0A6M3LH80_9ZZZZ